MVRRVDDRWYLEYPEGRAEWKRERSEESSLNRPKALEHTLRFGFDRLYRQGYDPKSIRGMLEEEFFRYRCIEALEDERTLREHYQYGAPQESWAGYEQLDAQFRLAIRYLLSLDRRRCDGEEVLPPAELRCPECRQRLRVPAAKYLKVRCPACKLQWEGIYFS